MKLSTKALRPLLTLSASVFALVTLFLMANKGFGKISMAALTLLFVWAPFVLEKLLKKTLPLPLYLFCLFYALGPMLGKCYLFYHTVPHWDKLLHFSGGLVFALLGYLAVGSTKQKPSPVICAAFALFFSVSVSVFWEFGEFFSDVLFGTDSQMDTLIHSIHSTYLGSGIGNVGKLSNITSLSVNGAPLPITGYLDIGLFDTMADMLYESAGAVLAALGLFCSDCRKKRKQKKGTEMPKGDL